MLSKKLKGGRILNVQNGKMTKQIVNSTKLPVTVKTRLGWDENTKHIVEVIESYKMLG